jgi:MFS family permease
MATTAAHGRANTGNVVETDTPARLDRLPWSRWHWRIVIGLGAVWILDGLEVNFIGMISSRLSQPGSGLTISSGEAIAAGAVYVAGACFGALLFGHLTDRFGRKRLFMITLALYLTATVLTGLSFNIIWFYAMRFLTGAGIGGEYAAINSAIDELIPARVRGTIDLWINGSFWFGTVLAGGVALLVLDPSIVAGNVGWRLGFGAGALLGLGILFVRRQVPESPRWLVIHGKADEADEVVSKIEREVLSDIDESSLPEVDPDDTIKIEQRRSTSFMEIARTILTAYPRRTVVGLSLFAGQAFLYNAVVFGQAALLSTFFGVSSDQAPLYIIPFAVGNLLGPLLLGRLFDTVGRRPMIAGTYILSGVLLAVSAFLFKEHTFGPWGLTAAWCVIFFFASAGASSAYLTVSEIFPMETRALAIALFYAVGTAIGGITGPLLFSKLVSSGSFTEVFWGYILGAAMMIGGGLVEAFLGFDVEQQRLEQIAEPLSAVDGDGDHEQPERAKAVERPARVRQRRLGPGSTAGWSRSPLYPPRIGEGDVHRRQEVEAISGALHDTGPMTREQLAQRVGARFWGPGRFPRALRQAQAEGTVHRVGRRYTVASG